MEIKMDFDTNLHCIQFLLWPQPEVSLVQQSKVLLVLPKKVCFIKRFKVLETDANLNQTWFFIISSAHFLRKIDLSLPDVSLQDPRASCADSMASFKRTIKSEMKSLDYEKNLFFTWVSNEVMSGTFAITTPLTGFFTSKVFPWNIKNPWVILW